MAYLENILNGYPLKAGHQLGYRVLRIAYCVLRIAYCVLGVAYWVLRIGYCVLRAVLALKIKV